MQSLDYNNVEVFLASNIWFLCLYKNERIIEFIEALRSLYEDSIKRKLCLICMNNIFVSSNGHEE